MRRGVKSNEVRFVLAKNGILVSTIIPLLGYIMYGIALGSLSSIGYSTLAGILYTFTLYSPFIFFPSLLPLSAISYFLASIFLYKAYKYKTLRKYGIIAISLSVSYIVLYVYNLFFVELIPKFLMSWVLIGFYEIGNTIQLLAWRVSLRTVLIKVYGLPNNLKWKINIEGQKYTFSDSQAKVKVNKEKPSFYVDSILEGYNTYMPKPNSGIISSNLLEIYFTKISKIPDISNWDPKLWIGNKINEYEVIDIIAIGGSSYVLKVKRANMLYAMKIPKISKSTPGQTRISASNIIIGGIIVLIASLVSITTREPLIDHLIKILLITGDAVIGLGIIGLIGSLTTLYGVYKNNWKYMVSGGILGLFAPCILSILSIIGGVLEIKGQKVSK